MTWGYDIISYEFPWGANVDHGPISFLYICPFWEFERINTFIIIISTIINKFEFPWGANMDHGPISFLHSWNMPILGNWEDPDKKEPCQSSGCQIVTRISNFKNLKLKIPLKPLITWQLRESLKIYPFLLIKEKALTPWKALKIFQENY